MVAAEAEAGTWMANSIAAAEPGAITAAAAFGWTLQPSGATRWPEIATVRG